MHIHELILACQDSFIYLNQWQDFKNVCHNKPSSSSVCKTATSALNYSHVSLSLDDGVHILGVDHAEHPVTEHAGGCRLHHGDRKAAKNIYTSGN